MTMLMRFLRGLNLGGMESQVLRPMMTAFWMVYDALFSFIYTLIEIMSLN